MTVSDCFALFVVEQQIRGNSSKTVDYYRNCVKPLFDYLSPSMAVDMLTIKDIKGFALYLRQKPISSNSVKTYTKGCKAFLSWLYQEQFIKEDLSAFWSLPKASRNVIDILTDNEVKAILRSFDQSSYLGLRNYCICALMVDSGLRRGEVVRLSVDDLHIAEGYAVVTGKGDKQRFVPLGFLCRKSLLRYLAVRPACVPSKALFLTTKNTPITYTTIERLSAKVKKSCLTPRFHPHLLRHTFATRYLENGGNIYALQQILGHTSLEMVKKYVHLTTRKNVVNFSNYSPLDNFK